MDLTTWVYELTLNNFNEIQPGRNENKTFYEADSLSIQREKYFQKELCDEAPPPNGNGVTKCSGKV